MRHELKRFVYICDGLAKSTNAHCSSSQVIDAPDERAADGIARERGWNFDAKTGALMCNSRDHKALSDKMGRPKRDPKTCEHNVVRVNDHYYVCTKCGSGGSREWADRWVKTA